MTYYKRPAPGQATMANSEPVVLASDHSDVKVTLDGESIAVSSSALPTGAATEVTSVAVKDAVESIDINISSIYAAVDGLEAPIQTQGAVYTPGATTVISGVRQDATGAPSGVADGDVHPFVFNEEGRLKVSAQPAIYTATTGNITANGQTVSVDVSRASNLMIHMTTSSLSNHNVTFEGSLDGGTTWVATQVVRTNANTVELTSGTLAATPAYGWEASVNAFTNFRVRATAHTSGTATWRFLPGAYATEPIPAIQTHAVTGSGNFAVTMAANATTTPAKARDGVAGGTDTGIPNLFIRRDTPTAVTPIAGDWEIPQISANGEQWVRLAGELADDAALTKGTTRVVPIGGAAISMDGTDPGSVSAENDAAVPLTDLNRILLVNQTHPRFFRACIDYAAAQTNATVVAAPGAGLSLYITDLVISNGATAGNITLLDGSGGSLLFELYPAVNGGVSMSFRNPIKLTANTLLATTSTTVTTHAITVTGYIAA